MITIDILKTCSKCKENNVLDLNHFTNLQPLCFTENLKKNDRIQS